MNDEDDFLSSDVFWLFIYTMFAALALIVYEVATKQNGNQIFIGIMIGTVLPHYTIYPYLKSFLDRPNGCLTDRMSREIAQRRAEQRGPSDSAIVVSIAIFTALFYLFNQDIFYRDGLVVVIIKFLLVTFLALAGLTILKSFGEPLMPLRGFTDIIAYNLWSKRQHKANLIAQKRKHELEEARKGRMPEE